MDRAEETERRHAPTWHPDRGAAVQRHDRLPRTARQDEGGDSEVELISAMNHHGGGVERTQGANPARAP